MKICIIIGLIICLADFIAEIIEYFYRKHHNWNKDRGYQMWLSYKKSHQDTLK